MDAFPIRPDGCDGTVGPPNANCGECKAAAGRKQSDVEKKFRRHFARFIGFPKRCNDSGGAAAPFSEKRRGSILKIWREVCCVWAKKPRENWVSVLLLACLASDGLGVLRKWRMKLKKAPGAAILLLFSEGALDWGRI